MARRVAARVGGRTEFRTVVSDMGSERGFARHVDPDVARSTLVGAKS